MRRAITLSMLSLLAGCAPQLTEGRYGCADDACPPGWFCHADDVCRSTPPTGGDAGALDGGPLDDAGPAPFLAPCTADSQCATGRCYRGRGGGWPTGYCTASCTGDGECTRLSGEASCDTGTSDACIILCDDLGPSCPTPLRCVGIYRDPADPGFTLGECFSADAPIAASDQRTCTGAVDCGDSDFMCAGGACARPCHPTLLACAATESCTSSPVGPVCR